MSRNDVQGRSATSQLLLTGSMERLLTTDRKKHTHTKKHKGRVIDVKLPINTATSGVAKQFN